MFQDQNYRPRIFETNSKQDWTSEFNRIKEKHNISISTTRGVLGGSQLKNVSSMSQDSHAMYSNSQHQRQQSIGGSSNNNFTATQLSLSTLKLTEDAAVPT